MDVKEATDKAREYVTVVFADEEITQLGLEEVMYDVDSEQWRITFGFARPWDQQNTVAVRMGLKTPRAYKVVHINNGDGRVVALTDRLMPELNAPENAQETPPPVATAEIAGPGEVADAPSCGNGPADENWDDVLRLIGKITAAASGGNYVFRGEAKQYPEVCSGLYREFRNAVKAGCPLEPFAAADLNDAKLYTREDDNWKILSHIQHYGGVTNLVDFTKDVNVALFFACEEHFRDNGRIIILERKDSDNLKFHKPKGPADRAQAQKSVLVQPKNGVIEDWCPVNVPSRLKVPVMKYLHECRNIDHRSMYSGYHGFIRLRHRYWKAFAHVDKAKAYIDKKEYHSAVKHVSIAIDRIEILHTYTAMDVREGLARAYWLRAKSYDALCKKSCADRDRAKFSELAPATTERILEIFGPQHE